MRWVDCVWLLPFFFAIQSSWMSSVWYVCLRVFYFSEFVCCRRSVWCRRCFSSSSCLFHVFVYGFVGSLSCVVLPYCCFRSAALSFSLSVFFVLFFRRAMPCLTFEWNWFNWTLRSQRDVYTQRILEFFIQAMERETARTRTELQPLLLYWR